MVAQARSFNLSTPVVQLYELKHSVPLPTEISFLSDWRWYGCSCSGEQSLGEKTFYTITGCGRLKTFSSPILISTQISLLWGNSDWMMWFFRGAICWKDFPHKLLWPIDNIQFPDPNSHSVTSIIFTLPTSLYQTTKVENPKKLFSHFIPFHHPVIKTWPFNKSKFNSIKKSPLRGLTLGPVFKWNH